MNTNRSPMCLSCNALLQRSKETSTWIFYKCPSCEYENADLIGEWLPVDEDTHYLFYEIAMKLRSELNISLESAIGLVEEYYSKFTNADYCDSLGINVQDEDFFHSEGIGMVYWIVFFVVEKNVPDYAKFVEWRSKL